MNIPCSTPAIDCDGDSVLIPGANAELPDRRLYFAYSYFLDYSQLCQSLTPIVAGICTPAGSGVYSSNAQTCVIDCSGTPLSYTAPSGAALGLTQAEADATAYALACLGAEIVCDGGSGLLVPNEAQSCNVACPDGSVSGATIAAGSVMGFTLAEANAAAFAIACQLATSQCGEPPPQFGNSAVSANSECPAGDGTFTYRVPANTFFASTQDEANATAQSYADQQSVLDRSCLKDIQDVVCGQGDTFYSDIITTTLPGTLTWSITSGSLPPGLSFSDGIVSGTPFTAGAYSFTVLVQSSNGNSITRTYSIAVIRIINAAIPDGQVGVPYSHFLTQSGATSPVWSSTKLPTGLTLNASTGEISGTPTEITSNPNLFVTLTQGVAACTVQFSIEMLFLPMDWWKMDEAGNVPRVGEVNSISLPCDTSAGSVAGGKYGNATALSSQGTPANIDCECGNTSVPVTGMAYSGNGIDAFVWIDNPAGSINSDTILLLTFADSAGVPIWQMRFTVDNQVGVEYDMTGGASGNVPLATSTAYRFYELYYDPSLTRFGIRINDGAVMDQWITVAAPPATAKGAISITYDRRTNGTSAANVCEMTVYPAVLNSTQRAYIYNAGAGQTWPVTLP